MTQTQRTGRTGQEAVAQRYREALAGGGLQEFEITDYDRIGVPVVATVWEDPARPGTSSHGVGYGEDLPAATIGALGELAERVLVNPTVRALPRRRASYSELRNSVGADAVADPVSLVLPAGSDYTVDRPLDWVPVRRWRTGETVWAPVEFIASDGDSLPGDAPPGGWLTTAITNGLGAGESAERAVGHALLELVQRDGDTVSFRAMDQGVLVDLATSTDPVATGLVERMRSVGVQPVVKLASTELACVVYCVGRDDAPDTPPIAVTAIGEAAHPDRDTAIRKALLEFASSRARRAFAFGPLADVERRHPDYLATELARPIGPQEPRALAAMTDWTHRSAAELSELMSPMWVQREVVPVDALPAADPSTWADPAALLDHLLTGPLADFDVLALATGVDGAMRGAKVLAPGLEVETLSYLRIGERVLRRLLDRDSDLVGLGAPRTAGQLPILLTAEATERIGGPAWLDRDAVERTVGELYPLYREPARHAVQRAERAR